MEEYEYEGMTEKATEGHQRFQTARFNVLAFCVTKEGKKLLQDHYVYAWQEGVYPLGASQELHRPFASMFRVSADAMSALSKVLDDLWHSDSEIGFDVIERKIKKEYGKGAPTDSSLRMALTYFKMKGDFDQAFWKRVIDGQGPGYVRMLLHPLDRAELEF